MCYILFTKILRALPICFFARKGQLMSYNQEPSASLAENMDYIKKILHVGENYDLIYRFIKMGGRDACLYMIDGFCKDEIIQKLLEYFSKKKPEEVPDTAHKMSKEMIPYGEISLGKNFKDIFRNLFSGVTVLFVDGFKDAILIDCRTYPSRSVDQPEKDKVMRGSRDGFVETLVFNTALIRRRIRNPELAMEHFSVGETSQTDIVLSYMRDRVEPKVLDEIKNKLQNIKVDALTMNQESLAECLYQRNWINPFPKFRFSERPDTSAASILEGNIVILVDNSPAAMIIPTTIFDIIEDADDYYFPPITGTYLRISRLIINIMAILLTPTFLLLLSEPDWIPDWLQFIQIKENINVPLLLQFLILEFAIDGLRLASLNTPSMLSTPLSVVAGIVLGDFTVQSGWFNSEVMLYMAFVAIANYTQSSFELGYALKFMRIIILCLTSFFGIWGYAGGLIFTVICIVSNRTLSGKSYIYPLIPFHARQFAKRILRIALPVDEKLRRKSREG